MHKWKLIHFSSNSRRKRVLFKIVYNATQSCHLLCLEYVVLHLSAINKPLFWKPTLGCPAAPLHVPVHTQRAPFMFLTSCQVHQLETHTKGGREKMSSMLTGAWDTTSLHLAVKSFHTTLVLLPLSADCVLSPYLSNSCISEVMLLA